jgi:hypothetical protein
VKITICFSFPLREKQTHTLVILQKRIYMKEKQNSMGETDWVGMEGVLFTFTHPLSIEK